MATDPAIEAAAELRKRAADLVAVDSAWSDLCHKAKAPPRVLALKPYAAPAMWLLEDMVAWLDAYLAAQPAERTAEEMREKLP